MLFVFEGPDSVGKSPYFVRLRETEQPHAWRRLREEYRRLASQESQNHRVVTNRNEGTLDAVISATVSAASPAIC
jgi:thymidylate kinase